MNNFSFESLVFQMPGMFSIKDKESHMVVCNAKTMDLLGYQSIDSIHGITDFDIRCDAVQFADLFIKQDRHVLLGNELHLMHIVKYSDNKIHIMLSHKKPFLDNDHLIQGILCQSMDVPLIDMTKIINQLTLHHVEEPLSAQTILGTDILNNTDDIYHLTEREQEVLYFTIRGASAKKTGHQLGISAKTVEFHLVSIKEKFAVINKAQLIDKAITLGYLYVLPSSLLPVSINKFEE